MCGDLKVKMKLLNSKKKRVLKAFRKSMLCHTKKAGLINVHMVLVKCTFNLANYTVMVWC